MRRVQPHLVVVIHVLLDQTASIFWAVSTEPRADHAQYIQSWLKVLKADTRAIFTAASKAQQATDWLITRAGESARAAEVAA